MMMMMIVNVMSIFGFAFTFKGTTVLDTKTTSSSQWTSGDTAATRVRAK